MKNGLLNIAVELKKTGVFKSVNNIIDMGTKTLRIHYDELEYLFNQANIKFNSNKFKFLKNFPKGKRKSTKLFWEELGIKNYNCLDINKEKDSIYCDLNVPFNDKKHIGKYDLVTDFGNNEHVFNVGEAYKTMYKLCKKNGFIWIFQQVYNGNGFFHFDISFFEGFSLANKLNTIYAAYIVLIDDYEQFLIPANKNLLDVIDLNKVKSIDITYVFRKTSNQEFKYYYQYNMKNKKNFYSIKFIQNKFPPERYYIQTKPIKDIKHKANKGDSFSEEWIRATGIKKK